MELEGVLGLFLMRYDPIRDVRMSLSDLRSTENPIISVKKINPFYIFIVLGRYWVDFDNFLCFEQVST